MVGRAYLRHILVKKSHLTPTRGHFLQEQNSKCYRTHNMLYDTEEKMSTSIKLALSIYLIIMLKESTDLSGSEK